MEPVTEIRTDGAGGDYPTEDTVIDSLEEAQALDSPFLGLFTPRAKAAIVDALLEERGEPRTVSELAEINEHVTSSSFNRHREDLEDYGLLKACGKRGNAQTYAIDVEHPLSQALLMVENVITFGKTPVVIDEQYIGEPGENYDGPLPDTGEDSE